MKRILSVLVVCLLFLTFTPSAMAEQTTSFTSGDYKYRLLEDGSAEITGYLGEMEGDIQIPAKLDGVSVTSIAGGAFNQAFLKSISIPNSVKKIGSQAFAFNYLTTIDIPEGVTELGSYVFNYCTELENVVFPDSLEKVGDGLFAHCTELSSVSVSPNSRALKIENGGLYSKNGDRLLCYLQGSGSDTFVIPEGTKTIDSYSFPASQHPTVMEIPASVTEIGALGFPIGDGVREIRVSEGNRVFASVEGVLFNQAEHIVLWYPRTAEASEYEIPEGTKTIGTYAFSGCRNLRVLIVPASVKDIGNSAFGTRIPGLIGPDLAVIVEEGSFAEQYCKQNKIRYFHSVSEIPDTEDPASDDSEPDDPGSDDWLSGLIDMNKPPANTGESGKKEILTSGNFQYRVLENGTAEIVKYQFQGDKNAQVVMNVPAELDGIPVTAIGQSAFSELPLVEAVIPEGVEVVGDYAFSMCHDLSRVVLPDGLKKIGSFAFMSCFALKEITVPDSVTEIGMMAFATGSSDRKGINVVCSQGSYAEEYCEKNTIRHVTPEKNKALDQAAFTGMILLMVFCLAMALLLKTRQNQQKKAVYSLVEGLGGEEIRQWYWKVYQDRNIKYKEQRFLGGLLQHFPSLCRDDDFEKRFRQTISEMERRNRKLSLYGGIGGLVLGSAALVGTVIMTLSDGLGISSAVGLLLTAVFTGGGILNIRDRKKDSFKDFEEMREKIEAGLVAIEEELRVSGNDRFPIAGPLVAIYENQGNHQAGSLLAWEELPDWVVKSGSPLLWANYLFNHYRLNINPPEVPMLAKYFPAKDRNASEGRKDVIAAERLREKAFYFLEYEALKCAAQGMRMMGAVLDLAIGDKVASFLCIREGEALKVSLYGNGVPTVLDLNRAIPEITQPVLRILEEAERALPGMNRAFESKLRKDGTSVGFFINPKGAFFQRLSANPNTSALDAAVCDLLRVSRLWSILKGGSGLYVGYPDAIQSNEDYTVERKDSSVVIKKNPGEKPQT